MALQCTSEKEKFRKYYNFFNDKIKKMSTTIEILDYLTTHEEDYTNLITISPAFMSVVISNFWSQAVIGLYAFYYENNDFSFKKFFNYTKANWNKIFPQSIELSGRKSTKFNYDTFSKTIEDCESLIKQNQSKIALLRDFRDKVFAHFGDITKEKEKKEISVDILQEILLVTVEIFNKIVVYYDGVIIAMPPLNARDIHQLCWVIKMYMTFQDEIRNLYRRKQNEEMQNER